MPLTLPVGPAYIGRLSGFNIALISLSVTVVTLSMPASATSVADGDGQVRVLDRRLVPGRSLTARRGASKRALTARNPSGRVGSGIGIGAARRGKIDAA